MGYLFLGFIMFSIAIAIMRVKFNSLYNRMPAQRQKNWKQDFKQRVSRASRDLGDPEEQKEPFFLKEDEDDVERLDSTWIQSRIYFLDKSSDQKAEQTNTPKNDSFNIPKD